MKVILSCFECSKNRIDDDRFYPVNFQEVGVYHFTCDNGHENHMCLQEMKFEILSEMGINALADGYYREAIVAFASCLERYHEFYIRCICLHHDISSDQLKKAWKGLSRQSERQLGAYIFLYLCENNKPPVLLPNSMIKLRNDVVHNGKIPTEEEGIEFGRTVYSIVGPELKALKQGYDSEVNEIVTNHITANRKSISHISKNVSFSSMRTLINIATSDNDQLDFNDWLERNRRHLKWARSV